MRNFLTTNLIVFVVATFGFAQTGPPALGSNDGSSNLQLWFPAEFVTESSVLITSCPDLIEGSQDLTKSIQTNMQDPHVGYTSFFNQTISQQKKSIGSKKLFT